MIYPKKGTMVKVKWFDAFTYLDHEESSIPENCISITKGEWADIKSSESDGKIIDYANINSEEQNGTGKKTYDGTKIPVGWIISIEEYEPKNDQSKYYTSEHWEWKQNCN